MQCMPLYADGPYGTRRASLCGRVSYKRPLFNITFVLFLPDHYHDALRMRNGLRRIHKAGFRNPSTVGLLHANYQEVLSLREVVIILQTCVNAAIKIRVL
jgi:hypothetical protein